MERHPQTVIESFQTRIVLTNILIHALKLAVVHCVTQDSKKYVDTTSFVVTAVTTNLVVTVLLL